MGQPGEGGERSNAARDGRQHRLEHRKGRQRVDVVDNNAAVDVDSDVNVEQQKVETSAAAVVKPRYRCYKTFFLCHFSA